MSAQPIVSVLMTSFNREKYIESAIQSVLNSSLKDFELIVVDDGSKDRTVEIAQAFASKDKRVKVYINVVNQGDYPNRNVAASYANGKYLKYVDADDLIYPWGLELLVSMMEANVEAGWGLCSLRQDKERIFPFLLNPSEAYNYHYFGPGLFHKAPLSSIIRKDVFNAVGKFSSQRMVGDFELWHRLAQKYSVLLMPEGMVWYRVHDSQEMNNYTKYLIRYDQITATYLRHHECPLSLSDREKAFDHIIYKKRKQFLKSILKFDFGNARLVSHQISSLRKS